ncbi:MAG: HEAT repeat domain-containing protein, partial [Verrucomicrobia bacterium]|nr:HEAT repeat domain-containing protein [Verrucomicrobiota bacterium]
PRSLPLVLCLLWLLPRLPADTDTADTQRVECRKSAAFFAPPDSPDNRKYAPDRKIQIEHLALDVTPDFKRRSVSVVTTLTFKPIAKPLEELRLDAIDLTLNSVSSTEPVRDYQATDKEVIVTFANPIPAGKEARVTLRTYAEPTQGFYFRTPEMGYKPGDEHFFTQGEAIEARHWYPCFDEPNMKFTSEITCRVPAGMTVLSNGRLLSETTENGRLVAHWAQEKPHSNYLISLLAGYFKKVEDKYRDVPLAFYTPASEIREAPNSFRDTKDVMRFYDDEIGVRYPWAKYYQVCVNDFVAGGMENTSITTLTDYTLFTLATENIRDSQGLVAHEMAHQWFGDLVTCRDWSQIWLNEGFATFYAHLYDGHKNGHDAMLYGFYHDAQNILGQGEDTRPIVYRKYDAPMEQFSYLAYPKGSWVLRMLRAQLGDDLYRRCIQTYLERHQYGNVVTEDLNQVVEQLSGRSFDQFFDQWVYHGHEPELDVHYRWDEKSKLAGLTIQQNQKLSDEVLLFDFPLTVRFKTKAATVDRHLTVKQKTEDFYFPLEAAPEVVRVDPDYVVLAKVTFKLPESMLVAQLTDRTDVMGRILAIQQLADRKDHEAVAKLKGVLRDDPFWGVRIEAAKGLRGIHTDEALDALLASMHQPDARVRNEVMGDIGGFYADKAYTAELQSLGREQNPDIEAQAIGALGGYAKPAVRETLLKDLESDSYRNRLADAAIGAMRSQDDPGYLDPLRQNLQTRKSAYTTFGFNGGLNTLAYLARNQEKKDRDREFLIGYINDLKQNVRLAAIRALGTLGDPKAIAVLQTFATAAKDSPERQAAEKAITTLRADRQPVDDFKNLRQEVLDLEKTTRDLRQEIDDLNKKLAAEKTRPAKTKSSKPPRGF